MTRKALPLLCLLLLLPLLGGCGIYDYVMRSISIDRKLHPGRYGLRGAVYYMPGAGVEFVSSSEYRLRLGPETGLQESDYAHIRKHCEGEARSVGLSIKVLGGGRWIGPRAVSLPRECQVRFLDVTLSEQRPRVQLHSLVWWKKPALPVEDGVPQLDLDRYLEYREAYAQREVRIADLNTNLMHRRGGLLVEPYRGSRSVLVPLSAFTPEARRAIVERCDSGGYICGGAELSVPPQGAAIDEDSPFPAGGLGILWYSESPPDPPPPPPDRVPEALAGMKALADQQVRMPVFSARVVYRAFESRRDPQGAFLLCRKLDFLCLPFTVIGAPEAYRQVWSCVGTECSPKEARFRLRILEDGEVPVLGVEDLEIDWDRVRAAGPRRPDPEGLASLQAFDLLFAGESYVGKRVHLNLMLADFWPNRLVLKDEDLRSFTIDVRLPEVTDGSPQRWRKNCASLYWLDRCQAHITGVIRRIGEYGKYSLTVFLEDVSIAWLAPAPSEAE